MVFKKKQAIVVLSFAEAEYLATTSAAYEAVWPRRIFRDIQDDNKRLTIIFYDNMLTNYDDKKSCLSQSNQAY